MIAAHAEDAVGHDDRTAACLRREPKRSLELAHVKMFVDVLLGWSSKRDRRLRVITSLIPPKTQCYAFRADAIRPSLNINWHSSSTQTG